MKQRSPFPLLRRQQGILHMASQESLWSSSPYQGGVKCWKAGFLAGEISVQTILILLGLGIITTFWWQSFGELLLYTHISFGCRASEKLSESTLTFERRRNVYFFSAEASGRLLSVGIGREDFRLILIDWKDAAHGYTRSL